MRLIELEIHNIRGICDLLLKPNGKNIVIWGSNGSGKSAVVDAIDFLLTGRITRLTGKGTGDIKLEKHGTHIDHKPEQATVRGIVSISNYPKPIEIKRCMINPGKLEYSDSKAKPFLEPILAIATRGQYVLTRREILKYITAEPGSRAQEIQTILDIQEIEDVRKVLIRVENDCKKEFDDAKKSLSSERGEITAAADIKLFEEETLLQWVNSKRALLGAAPITALKSSELKTNIIAPVFQTKETTINPSEVKTNVDNLKKFIDKENTGSLMRADAELRESLHTVQANPGLFRSLKKLQLFQWGSDLIDDTGTCPLCDKPWDTGQLREHLKQHINEAVLAQQYQDNINLKSQSILDAVSDALARIKKVIDAAALVGLKEEKAKLESWRDDIDKIVGLLANPVEKYKLSDYSTVKIQSMIAPAGISLPLEHVSAVVQSTHPKTTPKQEAWDALTKMETRLSSYEKAGEVLKLKSLVCNRSTILRETFTSSRDRVLKSIYDSVRDRFVELYRQIHGSDESNFTAEIKPAEAGLDFTVDFYGRGSHPPHAMHSEGHQDSMGLCLYLALAEKLTRNVIDLVILDDVVMSVDVGHRRHICELLSGSFSKNQFLVTTHDRTWANQLRTSNVVDSEGMVQFYNWHVNTGPQVDFQADIWGRIDDDLKKDDVSSAAGRLRQNAEQFFAMVCDSLQAPVVYKFNSLYDFGNLLDGAISQYKGLLAKAKKAAQSWGRDDEFQKLQEFDSIAKEIYGRTNAEKWPINPAVHYNNWVNLSKQDFQPVVEAFRDLYTVFVCSKCSNWLHLVTANGRQEAVRCNCAQVDWNLVPKDKSTNNQGNSYDFATES